MLIARKINYFKESEIVKRILIEENIEDKNLNEGIIYVLEEDGHIIGTTKITKIDSTTGILNYLVITKDKDNKELKDGILRSILNYCYSKGIYKVYSIGKNDFLIKEGFKNIDINSIDDELRNKINSNIVLECDVKEFFDKGCPSCRRS